MKTTPDIAAAQRFVAETLEPEPEDLSDGKLWKPQVIDAGDGHKSVVFEPAPRDWNFAGAGVGGVETGGTKMDNGCCIDFVQALEEGYFEWTPEYEAYTVLMGEQGIVIMHGVKYCPFCGTLLERPDNET